MLTNDSKPTCGILYIDDEEKALKYFRMAFSDKFKVFTAPSGKEGIEILRREAQNIGIVISDQRMPEMLGAEILELVRNEYPNIVRLLTTAYSDLDSAIQAVNKGHIYQYVVKPWEVPELGMILQRAADYHQILTERNELLAIKMTTLQRIVCSDRLKWLLLASRSWDKAAQTALRRVLAALLEALPGSPEAFASSGANARQFELGHLIRGEYDNATRCLDALAQAPAAADTALQAMASLLGAEAKVAGTAPAFELQVGTAVSEAAFRKVVFGVLFEAQTSEASISLFQALYSIALTGGTLSISGTDWNLTLPLAQEPDPAAEAIIDALAAKFSQWDISRL